MEVVRISFDGNAKSGILPDGTYVLALADFEPKWIKGIRYGPMKQLARLETRLFAQRQRTKQILETDPYQPAFRFIGFGIGVANLVKRLDPSFVFAQQAVRFGFAAALCHRWFPTILMPYGQDIYRLALSSPIHRRLAEWSLKHIDMICPTSTSAVPHIIKEFGVNESKIKGISWGVDRSLFYLPDSQQKLALRAQYGIPADALVVMNARRFDVGWGSKVVTEAFLELARRDDSYYFIIIGGTFDDSYQNIVDLKNKVELSGFSDRFLVFEGGVSLNTFADLLKGSDIFTSLMLGSDMRSASILQGAATGSAPVLTDWPEYRYIEQLGFRALFVPMNDVEAVVNAVEYYREHPNKMREVAISNLKYIAQNEDHEKQMQILLETIHTVIDSRQKKS